MKKDLLHVRYDPAKVTREQMLQAALEVIDERGYPEARIADVAERVIDAVVNISTSQTVESRNTPTPQLPPGSPFEDFFEEFFKNRRGQGDHGAEQPLAMP